MDTQKMGTKRTRQLKNFSLFTCKLVIREKLVKNKNLNKTVVFIKLILSLTPYKSIPRKNCSQFNKYKLFNPITFTKSIFHSVF